MWWGEVYNNIKVGGILGWLADQYVSSDVKCTMYEGKHNIKGSFFITSNRN
jgi:hypothetical protein